MIEEERHLTPPWVPVLAQISRASGHELRNALNALVVNLEVVRGRATDSGVQPFMAQSVEQAEQSVRLAESAIALLDLVIGAIGPRGEVRCELTAQGGVSVASDADVDRTDRALRALAQRGTLRVDTSDSAVILTIPGITASTIRE